MMKEQEATLAHVKARLGESAWLGCDEYGIADIATYPWTKGHQARGVDDASHPNFMRWFKPNFDTQ